MTVPRVVLVCAILAGAGSAGAETFAVLTPMDGTDALPGDRRCDTGAGLCTLRAAVQEVNALFLLDPTVEHTITLPAAVYGLQLGGRDEDAAAMGDLDFRANVIVRGAAVPPESCPTSCTPMPGASSVIDARGEDRAVHVLQGKVIFENVVIRGGSLADTPVSYRGAGAGILNVAELELRSVALMGNDAEEGGGLKNEGTAALRSVAIVGNGAHGWFGVQCGGGISNSGTLILADALVAENAASSTGGGLCLGGTATVRDTVVRDNRARFGGGVSVPEDLDVGTVTLVDVRVRNNAVSASGGGILNLTTLSLERVTIANNRVDGETDCGMRGCGSGGGIANHGALTVTDCIIRENRAYDDGGGLWNAFASPSISGTLFSANLAGHDGAGIFTGASSMRIVNTTFSGNRANRYGGGIHAQDGADIKVRHATFTDNYGWGAGGALRTLGDGKIRVKGSVVTLNGGGNCRSDPVGGIISDGYNVENFDFCPFTRPTDRSNVGVHAVQLDALLRDNGGPNNTHALLPGSPAIDLVPAAECLRPAAIIDSEPLTTDQRGQPRPQGGACDAGAYEARSFFVPIRWLCCTPILVRLQVTLAASIALSTDLAAALKDAGSPEGAGMANALGAELASAHEALEALANATPGQGGSALFALTESLSQAAALSHAIDACCGKLTPEESLRLRTRLAEGQRQARRLSARVGKKG
jgi:predicted outer membrane repeat protein